MEKLAKCHKFMSDYKNEMAKGLNNAWQYCCTKIKEKCWKYILPTATGLVQGAHLVQGTNLSPPHVVDSQSQVSTLTFGSLTIEIIHRQATICF